MMRLHTIAVASIVFIAAVILSACQKDPYENLGAPRDFFAKGRVGSSQDFAIIKFNNSEDHVVTVHGFSDDMASCFEIAEAMNVNACKETDGQNCLKPYSCEALN